MFPMVYRRIYYHKILTSSSQTSHYIPKSIRMGVSLHNSREIILRYHCIFTYALFVSIIPSSIQVWQNVNKQRTVYCKEILLNPYHEISDEEIKGIFTDKAGKNKDADHCHQAA